jgi:uncharacterized protein (TIGR02271 family)
MTLDRLAELHGASVYDAGGDKIGTVEEIFYDAETQQPEWIGIGTGLFGTKRVLVPVQGASIDADAITVPYEKTQVKDSPDIDGDEISEHTERELSAYYALGGATRGSDEPSARRADRDGETDPSNVDRQSVTRSEEELRVGKREVDAGQVRLQKWVETVPVEAQVELQQERVHVSRERIDAPVSGAQIGEQEIEVTLRGEEAVVSKETVAKERVSLDKDVETEQRTVSDELRQERVEVEGDVTDAGPLPKRN